MLVSLEWIKDFVDLTASAQKIADRLTMVGLEIEGMEQVGEDTVMEVNVTPNRPDCLSILGIAREAAAAFDLPLKSPDSRIDSEYGDSTISVEIDDVDLCSRYAGRYIKGVKIAESPKWMKSRLEKCGIRSVNNVVDVTNYILLEHGHPLHAFDADKISGNKIRVSKAGVGNRIVTLDNVERELHPDTLIIWDAVSPVAIAGIMGGEDSSVSDSTENIFLESAYFAPESIRKSSKRLGLKSESSYRFERGTDKVSLETALNRAALLISQLCGGKVSHIVDVYPVAFKPVEIKVMYEKVDRLSGITIEKNEIHRLLNNIGIATEDFGEFFIARPPSFRGDIAVAVDIIEEIVRCYGYNKIPAKPPKAILSDATVDVKSKRLRLIKESIRRSGFDEVVNFSFMNSSDLDLLSLRDDDTEPRRRHVTLRNPLRQEECLLRTTLVPSLLRNLIYNLSRSTEDIRIFEIARVFVNDGNPLPSEHLKLAGLYFCQNSTSIWKEQACPFYIVKGAIEAIFSELRLRDFMFRVSEEAFLHPGKSSDIFIEGRKIGYIGEIGPHVIEKLDLKIRKPEIIIFELDLGLLVALPCKKITYSQIPKYPSIERDIAMIIEDSITSEELLLAFRGFDSDLIEGSVLFDYYKGKNIPENKKSIGVRVTYRAKDRTLTEDEVETIHAKLIDFVAKKTGAQLRGVSC